jgi:hypothetical protein
MGKWLILSYYSNLEGNAQSFCIDDRMECLVKQGIEIRVLSSICGTKHKTLSHTRVPSISPAAFRWEIAFVLKRMGIGEFWRKFLEALLILPMYPIYALERRIWGDGQWAWFLTATLTGYFLCQKDKISLIYSTGGPGSAHLAAGIISKLMGIPWIAELQDPMVHPNVGRNKLAKYLALHCEKFLFRRAKNVIFYTKKAKESAEKRNDSGKGSCIYPGARREIIPPSPKISRDKKLRFIHIGALYQSRNLVYFLDGLERDVSQRPELIEYFELCLYGGILLEHIEKQIERFPYKVIQVYGMVNRQKALESAVESDVLLLIQNTDERSSETIPTKVYEYLHMRKPMLNLIYKNEELKSMLELHGHTVVDADNPEQIGDAIVQYFDKWQKGQLKDGYLPSEYTVERATSQLIDLVANIR